MSTFSNLLSPDMDLSEAQPEGSELVGQYFGAKSLIPARSYRAVASCEEGVKEMMEVKQGSALLTRTVWEVLKQKATGGKERDGAKIS